MRAPTVSCARALALGLAISASAGCTLIFGDVTRGECTEHDDCFTGEVCGLRGRCVPAPPDLGPEVELDLAVGADAQDATPDAEADAELPLDMAPADIAVDAAIDQSVGPPPPFGPAGDCFAGGLGGQFTPDTPPTGALHAPQVGCTPYARLWTAADPLEGLSLAWDVDGDAASAPEDRLDMADGGAFEARGGVVVLPRLNPAEQVVNIWRHDLRTGEGLFVVPSTSAQGAAARAHGRTAFVQSTPGAPDRVRVHFDSDDSFIDCGRPDRRQWGVAVGAGWTAWFEQRVGSRRARLVVLSSRDCADPARRERLLTGEVAPDARLHSTDQGVVWLQVAEDGRFNQLHRWRFLVPGADLEPIEPQLAEAGNPIELATRGRRMALVSYRPARPSFVIDLVDLDSLMGQPIGAPGVLRRPALSDAYVVWAAQTSGRWEIRYEQLVDR